MQPVVTGPPVVVAQPESRTNTAGTDASFSVAATGSAPLRYQWRFNASEIAGATGMTYTRTNVQSAAEGNYRIMLCERGVRTFADHARNTLDLSVVPAVKHLSHLPILVDPSHGTGRRDRVPPLARAAIAVGADGIMVEVHDHPEKALSDGPQAMYPDQFAELVKDLRAMAPLVSRTF